MSNQNLNGLSGRLKTIFAERLNNGSMHHLMTDLYTVYSIIKVIGFVVILMIDLTKVTKSIILLLSRSNSPDSQQPTQEANDGTN